MTAALAGCAGSDVTQDDVDTSYDNGYAAGVADTTPVSTMDTIVDRGSMKCGVKESQYGMGYLDATTGVRSGLDIAYCRAVAAAIGLNPDTGVEYIPASGSDRFDKLSSGTIDVLIRTTTWTTTTDADLNDWFSSRGIDFTSVGTADAAEATDKLISGECDAFTGHMSAMIATLWAHGLLLNFFQRNLLGLLHVTAILISRTLLHGYGME